MTKNNLPEITVTEIRVVDMAKDALAARATAVNAKTAEDLSKELVRVEADSIRASRLFTGEVVGKIIIPTDSVPVRVEFRIENGALELTEEPVLDRIYGASMPELFERAKVTKAITSLKDLVQSLENAGINPLDVLEVKAKKGCDGVVAGHAGVESAEAILPRTGFLARLADGVYKTLNESGQAYTKAYLEQVLKPWVVLGTNKESSK